MPSAERMGGIWGGLRQGRAPSRSPVARRSTGPWWRTTWVSWAWVARPMANTGLWGSPTGGNWAGSPTNTSRVRKGWAQRRAMSSKVLSTIEASSINTKPRCSRAMAVCSVSSQRSRSPWRLSLSRSSRWMVEGNQVACSRAIAR